MTATATLDAPSKPGYRFSGELPPELGPLAQLAQWLVWDYTYDAGRKRWDKPPRHVVSGAVCDGTKPANCGPLETALATVQRNGFAGIGFSPQPGDDITAIDLDHCIASDGSYTPLAGEILGYGETYAEVSPSGEGLRLFVQGKVERGFRCDAIGVEVYPHGHYVTVTGQKVEGCPSVGPAPRTLARLRAAVEAAKARPEAPTLREAAVPPPSQTELKRIKDALKVIPSEDRDIWLRVGMAIKSELGDAGFDLWREWSMRSIKFEEADARKVWRSITPEGGITIATVFALATERGWREGKATSSLSFTLFRDIDLEPRKLWMVRDFLGAGELSCFYGQPGAGKSTIAGDLACHIASGTAWFGKRIMHGGVLYVAAERVDLVKRRMAAFRKHHALDDIALAVVGGAADLRTSGRDSKLIIDYASRLSEACNGLPVRLIIIETINKVLAGGDENSSKDMGLLIGKLAELQETTGAHILTVHHMPVDAQRMRGHGSLLGACDTTVLVEKIGDVYTATIEKANDGPTGERVAFSMKAIELHRDAETGEVTAAPVIIPTSEPIPKRRDRLSANEKTMLGMVEDTGEKGLSQEQWYDMARAVGIGLRRPATLTDVKRSLEIKQLIHEEGGIVRALHPFQPVAPGGMRGMRYGRYGG